MSLDLSNEASRKSAFKEYQRLYNLNANSQATAITNKLNRLEALKKEILDLASGGITDSNRPSINEKLYYLGKIEYNLDTNIKSKRKGALKKTFVFQEDQMESIRIFNDAETQRSNFWRGGEGQFPKVILAKTNEALEAKLTKVSNWEGSFGGRITLDDETILTNTGDTTVGLTDSSQSFAVDTTYENTQKSKLTTQQQIIYRDLQSSYKFDEKDQNLPPQAKYDKMVDALMKATRDATPTKEGGEGEVNLRGKKNDLTHTPTLDSETTSSPPGEPAKKPTTVANQQAEDKQENDENGQNNPNSNPAVNSQSTAQQDGNTLEQDMANNAVPTQQQETFTGVQMEINRDTAPVQMREGGLADQTVVPPDTTGQVPEVEQQMGTRTGGGVSGVLNQLDSNITEELINRRSQGLTIGKLKEDIVSFHKIYDGVINVFKNPQHIARKNAALKSKDRGVVLQHYREMEEAISNYYKNDAGLKLGVIIAAESLFDGSMFGSNMNDMAATGSQSAVDRSSLERGGVNQFKSAKGVEPTYTRGGIDHALGKPVINRIVRAKGVLGIQDKNIPTIPQAVHRPYNHILHRTLNPVADFKIKGRKKS